MIGNPVWRNALYWVPAIIYMATIFYFSSGPAPEVFQFFDFRFSFIKSLHLMEFGILGGLYYFALRNTWQQPGWALVWIATLLAGCYGLTDEFHQSFVVGRTPLLLDAVTDTIGGCLGGTLGYSVRILRSSVTKV